MNQEIISNSHHTNSVIREQLIKRMEQRVGEEINDDAYRTAFMPCYPLQEKKTLI
jgi:hypothetical protein